MITSKGALLLALKKGGYIGRGCHTGYWLHFEDGKKKRVPPSIVKKLQQEGSICRTDGRTSRVGETWGLPSVDEKVKAAMDKVGSKLLNAEVEHWLNCQSEGEDTSLYLALEDAESLADWNDDRPMQRAARLVFIELGVYIPVTEAQLENFTVSAGRKFAFKLDGTKYLFEKHLNR